MGGRPANTRNVTSPARSASATAAKPSVRGIQVGAGAAAAVASSAVAAWPTSVINCFSSQTGSRNGAKNRPFRRPPAYRWDFALMLLYNNVAGLRQIRGAAYDAVAGRHPAL